MNKAKSIFYQNKINEFSRSPRHLFKLTSSLMGTSKKSQYPNIPAHIHCTQLSNQLNGKTLNTLRSIALNIVAVSPIMIYISSLYLYRVPLPVFAVLL